MSTRQTQVVLTNTTVFKLLSAPQFRSNCTVTSSLLSPLNSDLTKQCFQCMVMDSLPLTEEVPTTVSVQDCILSIFKTIQWKSRGATTLHFWAQTLKELWPSTWSNFQPISREPSLFKLLLTLMKERLIQLSLRRTICTSTRVISNQEWSLSSSSSLQVTLHGLLM